MRQILAVLNHVDTARPVLAAARLVARRLPAARIEVLHVRAAEDPGFMPSEEVMTPDRKARFEAQEAARSAALRGIFDAWRRDAGAEPAGAWREETGVEAEIVAREGARADLIVIGRAAHHEPGDGKAAITAALFASPPPVLLVPPRVPDTLGAHIALAWSPSETAEHAIVAATPLLHRAGRITILVGSADTGSGDLPGEAPPDLGAFDQPPAIHRFVIGREEVGASLLREAHAIGADLLVMGAYAHSRAIEALLGGATRDVLGHADMPVLLHH